MSGVRTLNHRTEHTQKKGESGLDLRYNVVEELKDNAACRLASNRTVKVNLGVAARRGCGKWTCPCGARREGSSKAAACSLTCKCKKMKSGVQTDHHDRVARTIAGRGCDKTAKRTFGIDM